jgi:hypothetical protein
MDDINQHQYGLCIFKNKLLFHLKAVCKSYFAAVVAAAAAETFCAPE